jgi:glucose/arabinose dehydrogenase
MINMPYRLIAACAACMFAVSGWALDSIELPPGFSIEEYASVPDARSMALGEQGTVFVSNKSGNSIFAVSNSENGVEVFELIDGLETPNGIAVYDGDLYVAENSRVTRYRDIETHLAEPPAAEVLDIDLPSEGWHGWRYIGFGPDGLLYIAIGAPCNICDKEGYANISRMNPDGSDREVYAHGVRNSVGFTWHPDNGELWFTDNGRDMLGDDVPPDELNNATEAGQHFGYPYCHAGEFVDPKLGEGKACADYRAPARKLDAHVAALGLKFYTGNMFPESYRGQIFIAEHGSWNRSEKSGYRLSVVDFTDGVASSYQQFATGWLGGGEVSGRPVDLLILKDGSMLVSDDQSGKIYRITYSNTASEETR